MSVQLDREHRVVSRASQAPDIHPFLGCWGMDGPGLLEGLPATPGYLIRPLWGYQGKASTMACLDQWPWS